MSSGLLSSVLLWPASSEPDLDAYAGRRIPGTNTILLKPERWTGIEFPLTSYVELPANITTGDWTVILHRPNCSHCERYLAGLRRQRPAIQLALLDVSSETSPHWEMSTDGTSLSEDDAVGDPVVGNAPNLRIASGRLSSDWEWFVTPPVKLSLSNGRVTSVETEMTR